MWTVFCQNKFVRKHYRNKYISTGKDFGLIFEQKEYVRKCSKDNTLNSRFAIVYNIKMHFGNINFSTARERPLTTGWYDQFCSKTPQFLNLN